MKKRFLAILLTLVMMLALLPTAAFAADTVTVELYDSLQGGNFISSIQVKEGEPFGDSLPTPSKEGYVFHSWYAYTTITTVMGLAQVPVEVDSSTLYLKSKYGTMLYAAWEKDDGATQPQEPEQPKEVSGSCGANLIWTLGANGTLTIKGTGKMDGYNVSPAAPWDNHKNKITAVVISDGVTSIGGFAFQYCTSLKSVTIPASVTRIESFAFGKCTGLKDVYYSGTWGQWEAIQIDNYLGDNDPLLNAAIHYNGASTHTHTWSTAWSSDASCHWHNCTASACDVTANSEKQGYGAHVYDNNQDATCNTCGYARTVAPVSDDDHLTPGGTPTSSTNINAQEYRARNWSETVKSYLYENSSGGLTRVECIGSQVVVEKYNNQFQLQASGTLPMELPIWGGFFSGEYYNFLVFGQNNEEENNSKEVIRIVKYSKGWERLGAVSLYGANTIHPFSYGSLRCAEYNGYLYIRTCHEMYTSSDGFNHQANMMINVRQGDMKITDSCTKIMNINAGYVSHSFNQFVLIDQEGRIVALDHGDASPRAAVLVRYGEKAGQDVFNVGVANTKVCTFPGQTGASDTGAAVGGFAETSNGYVTAYNYDGTASSMGADPRDVYLAFTGKNSSNTTTAKLSSGGDTSVPVLAPTGLDGGYVMWNGRSGSGWYSATFDNTLHYVRYGASGKAGAVQTATASLSDCAPINWNGKVVWYVTNNSVPTFYTLDGSGVKTYTVGAGTPGTPSSQQPTIPDVEPIPATGTAVPTTQTVKLDGKDVQVQYYAIKDAKGNATNYVKIRDLADALNGTKAQFNLSWDNGKIGIIPNTAYQPNGSENNTPYSGSQTYKAVSDTPVNFNGKEVNLTSFQIIYQSGGYTYYKLRDLGQLLNFETRWDSAAGRIVIETGKPYTGN